MPVKIRPSQAQQLSDASYRRFIDNLVSFIRDQHVDAMADPVPALRSQVESFAADAEQYSLETERQIASYVNACWVLGPGFTEAFPVMGATLRSPLNDPDLKAGWLDRKTKEIVAVMQEDEDSQMETD